MRIEDVMRDHRMERYVLAATLLGTAVACWRGTSEPFTSPKLAIVWIAAAALSGLGLFRALRTGRVSVPRGLVPYALCAFLVIGAFTVIRSVSTSTSILGQQGRGTGFALYLACAVLFVAVTLVVSERQAPMLLYALLGGVVVAAVYALVQHTGNDPVTWTTAFSRTTTLSTMGNPNFTSGFLALGVPLALYLLFGRPGLRLVGVVVVAGLAYAIFATESAQGAFAAVAGAGVVVLVLALEQAPARRRALLGALAVAGVAGVVVTLAGLAGTGPLAAVNDVGFDFRRHYWNASWRMFRHHVFDGVGFDMWGSYFRAERTADAATGSGFRTVADEPHSVPLAMLTGGGLALGAAYVVFIVATGVALVRGLLHLDGGRRRLLASIGGAWLAYQVQSFVSIDVPALPVAHFVLAGLVLVVAGGAAVSEIDLRRDRRSSRSSRRRVSWLPVPIAGVLGVVLFLVLASFALRLPRADYELRLASDSFQDRQFSSGVRHLGRAADLTPLPEPWVRASQQFAQSQQFEFSLLAARKALERNPRSFEAALNAARMAVNLEDADRAKRFYGLALELEPNAVPLRKEVVRSYRRLGLEDEAVAVGRGATERNPDDALAWTVRADAERRAGLQEDARRSYTRVLELDPGNERAKQVLARMDG